MTDGPTSAGGVATDHPWSEYKPGTLTSLGATVKEVLEVSTNGIVFLNTDDELQWEYEDSACVNGVAATAEASGLIAQLGFAGLSGENLRRAHLLIAAGLSCAFDDKSEQGERHFAAAMDFVQTRQAERLQTAYLLAVLISGLVLASSGLAALLRNYDPVQREFLIGVSVGAVGAVVSVSQRFRNIVINRYGSLRFIAIAGAARVLFGSLFGFTLVILEKSGLVLAGIGGNVYALAAAALVAGFSERLIPDLIGSLESTLKKGE